MNIRVKDIYETIDGIAPFDSCMSWDNVGLLVGEYDRTVKKILVTLDVTQEAIRKAKAVGANLIVSHHPVIFSPVKRVFGDSVVGRCLQEDISVISAHTNYDFAPKGINYALACELGLKNIRPLYDCGDEKPYATITVFVPETHVEQVYRAMSNVGAGLQGNYSGCGFLTTGEGRFIPNEDANPFLGQSDCLEKVKEVRLEMICAPRLVEQVVMSLKSAHPYEEPAYSIMENRGLMQKTTIGMMGDLSQSMSAKDFAEHCGAILHTRVAYTETEKMISTVALTGGAAGEFWKDALQAGSDAFITGEVKHHEWIAAREKDFCLMMAGHYETENVAMSYLAQQLQDEYPALEILVHNECPTSITDTK